MNTFSQPELEKEDQDYLRLFSFLCELSFDVYLKTQLIEQIADQLREERTPPKKK